MGSDRKVKDMKIVESKCPTCGKKLNAAKALEEQSTPVAGDISICFYCGSILSFQEDLSMKRMDIDELLSLPKDLQETLRKALMSLTEDRLKGR